MIDNSNYIHIEGWMVTPEEEGGLNLKGNELLVYAIIRGFSQDGRSDFHGSIAYLMEWTNSTKQGVIKVLKSLVERGLLIKKSCYPYNRYKAVKNCYCEDELSNAYYEDEVNIVNQGGKQSLPSSKHSLPNNIDNNIVNNKEYISEKDKDSSPCLDNLKNNKYKESKELRETVEEIVKYFNSTCGTNYRSTTGGTLKCIKARIKEGFNVEDFKTVIDYKWKEWGEVPKKFSTGQWSNTYLRPSTLFGSKMEEYLHQAWLAESSEGYCEPQAVSAPLLERTNNLTF